jgi:hypothetical protein
MREYIKDNWAGDVDIEGIRDNQIKGYIKKYLGKYSHIEDALRRAKREWLKEGDEKHKDTDCKKLWTNYYCDKLKIRLFTSNIKKLESEIRGDSPADLVKNMNNTTAENKPKVINLWLLPWYIKYNPAFTPYNGKIDPNDKVYSLLKNYIGERNNEDGK